MSKLLIPIHLDAKVVGSAQPVAALDGPAFNQTQQLEPGVHLHWALPDSLARARNVAQPGAGQTGVFPAVPDLWLILRFQPLAGAAPAPAPAPAKDPGIRQRPGIGGVSPIKPAPLQPLKPGIELGPKPQIELDPKGGGLTAFSARRDWKAWVLDSRTGISQTLEQWTPPTTRPAGRLTIVGELPEADALGMPGWGRWDPAKGDPQAYGAGYYPYSRKKFGFHDPASDVPANAEIGYVVVGWYADRNHDPLFRADDRQSLIERWQLAYESRIRSMLLSPAVAEATSAWVAPSLAKGGAGEVMQVSQNRMRQVDTLMAKRQSLITIDDKIAPGVSKLPLYELQLASEIVCHGSVVKVPRTPPAPSQGLSWQVALSPSLKRAAAELAGKGGGDVVSTEALLQDLEGQARTVGGFLDVPAALHALTFQAAPGASHWSAEIRLRSKSAKQAGDKRPNKDTPFDRSAINAVDQLVKATPSARLSSNNGYPGLSRDIGKLVDVAGKIGPSKQPAAVPPTDQQIQAQLPTFAQQLRAAFKTTSSKATQASKPINQRWVRVNDTRKNAPASSLAGLNGSAAAGWWLDITNDAHIRILLVASFNATLDLPDVARLFEQPGPRWYRPGVPHLSVQGIDRAYRYGFDGRYEVDGKLMCRLAGNTVTGNRAKMPGIDNNPSVPGSAMIERGPSLDDKLPGCVRSLVEEAALLDPTNAGLLAKNWRWRYNGPNEPSEADVAAAYEACNFGWALLRQPDLAQSDDETWRDAINLVGTWPSPIAVGPWVDPWLPLFVDVKYSHLPANLAQYQLGEIEYEIPGPAYPTQGATVQHTERCFLTSAVTQVVEGATITKFSIDQYGNPIPHGKIELAPDTFQRYDLLSAALGQIDDRLRAAGQHERSGRVKIDEIAVVDVFGSKRTWTPQNSNTDDPRHPQAPDSLIGCSPRLPHWSRLMCRFMSADSPGVEAEYGLTPVAGFLLPDFVEHALEVFDNKGQAIGQLLSDPPIRGKQGPKTLQVRFEPHAWLNHQGPAINAITNPYLKELVAGILAQPQVVPANAEKEKLFESGLTALLRVFDTAGGTVAWDGQHGERNIRLFGKPVAVVRTKLWIETSGAAKPGTDPQAHPAITVQIGAVTRPEDGVYGVFLPNAQPALSRFAPVDKQVVEQAVLNGLRDSVYRGIDVGKLDHPFVADPAVGQSRFTFTQNQQRELSIFVEVGASVTLTSGVLPRKKLSLEPWFIDPAVRHIEPTLAVGPVLAVPSLDGRPMPLLPYPDVPGHDEWWLERPTGNAEYEVRTIPQLPPIGSVPRTRVVVTEGWIRMEPSDTEKP